MLKRPVVDPSIESVVRAIQQMGYETTDSCAGQTSKDLLGSHHSYFGYVALEGHYEPEDMKGLAESLGLDYVTTMYRKPKAGERTDILFRGLGGPSGLR